MPRSPSVPSAPSALPVPWPLTLRLTLQDATRVHRLVLAVPDARGAPFLGPADAMRLALEVAAQVAEAGELARFRAPLPETGLEMPKEGTEEARAWLDRMVKELRAGAGKRARRRD